MDNKQIKELMTAMERSGITKLILKEKGGVELHLERQDERRPHGSEAPSVHHALPPAPHQMPHYPVGYHHPHLPHESSRSLSAPSIEENKEGTAAAAGLFIKSPMVGTFYNSPSPEDPPFVKVGDRIEPDTVVCIIEAMKVMNEVKAGVSGTVAELLVKGSQPVEFGTKLLRIVP